MKLRYSTALDIAFIALAIVLAILAAVFIGPANAQVTTDAGPAMNHSSITPSDSTDLTTNGLPYCRALFIEGAGDISITDMQNVTIVYTVPAGTLLPFRPKRVNSTGTTATGIACWRG